MAGGRREPLLVLVAACCAVGPSAAVRDAASDQDAHLEGNQSLVAVQATGGAAAPATCTDLFLQGAEMEPKSINGGRWKIRVEGCSWPHTGGEFESLGAPSGNLRGVREVTDASGRRHLLGEGVRVLHDLDDTLTCSGGELMKGIDAKCSGTKPGHLYPGVTELFYALSLGPYVEGGRWGEAPASPTVPFSARPEKLSFLLAIPPCRGADLQFRQRICGCEGGQAGCERRDADCACFGIDTERAQYGHIRDASDFADGEFARMGRTKFSNWYSNIYGREQKPTVFFGDNGQGDLVAAQWMLITSQKLDPKKGGAVAAFIHDVQEPPACASAACRSAWARHNVFFYQDYGEAASIASDLGLISADFAQRVALTVNLASLGFFTADPE